MGFDATAAMNALHEHIRLAVEGGDTIQQAAARLVANAPSVGVFNGIRVYADPGESEQTVAARYRLAFEHVRRLGGGLGGATP